MKELAVTQSYEFSANLPDSAEELEVVVFAEREKLKRSLDELSSTVRSRLDVRTRLREHPLVTVGAAAAAGAVLGVLSNRSRKTERRHGEYSGLHAAPVSGTGRVLGSMALTIATLVGQRLAETAADSVRSAFASRKPRFPKTAALPHSKE